MNFSDRMWDALLFYIILYKTDFRCLKSHKLEVEVEQADICQGVFVCFAVSIGHIDLQCQLAVLNY